MFEKGYLSLGVRIVSAYPLAFILGGAVLFFLSLVSLGVLAGPCLFGLAYMTRRALRGEEVSLADIFSGFEERVGTAFLCGLALLMFVAMTAAIALPFGSVAVNLPGFGNTPMHSDNKELASAGGNNRRGTNAGVIKRTHPLQLRSQLGIAVITEAVDAHRIAAARVGIGNGGGGT